MNSIDWPAGWERTPEEEREPNRSFQATLGQTTADFETEMERLDPDDWRASFGNQHAKSNSLPLHNANPDDSGFVLRWSMDGEAFAVVCDAYTRLRDNAREVFLWVHETRMRGQRAVGTGGSEFAAARLPPGDSEEAVVASGRTVDPPHEVLGVDPDAPEAVIRGAARAMKAQTHPDRGGSDKEFVRIAEAEEAMLDE